MSIFCCPLCSTPLSKTETCYRCPSGHSFDIAAAGYTHLLPANQKNSKFPGDDKNMVAARSAFLDGGYYATMADALCQLVAQDSTEFDCPTLLDTGCGEGYYTSKLSSALIACNFSPKIAGIDISKFALKKAAKRLPTGEFAVASSYHLPLLDDSVNLLVNIFSPLAISEFSRVMQIGEYFYYVVPSQRHLWQLKEVLYDAPYENPVHREDYDGFQWLSATPVRYTAKIQSSEHIMALFGMTPYAWKTPKAGVDRLKLLETLEVEIGFDIHRYQKI